MRPFSSSAGRDRAHRSAAVLPMLALLVLGASTAACGSKSAGTPPSTSTPTSTSAPATSTTLPSKAASGAEIEKAYMTLFDLASPAIPPKLASVQDGSALKAAFTAAIASSLAKQAGGASVLSVSIKGESACGVEALPAPCALVTYDILSPKHLPVLKNAKGFAVYLNGRWLVAKTTICTLLVLDNGGKTPAGC